MTSGDPAIARPVESAVARELSTTSWERMDVEMLPGYRNHVDEFGVDVAGLGQLIRDNGGSLLIVASVTPTGDTPLHYYGRSDWLYNARLEIKAYDLAEGRRFGEELTSDISYTGLNASSQAEAAIGPLAARLADTIEGMEAR